MPKNRDFGPLEAFPANQWDALNEFLGTQASANFLPRIRPSDPTTLEVVAGAGNDQVSLAIEGKWRYISATVSRGGASGAARTLDVYAVTGANSFAPGTPGEIDSTDYTFGLRIVETGALPAGFAHVREVATAVWDGVKFESLTPLIGPGALVADLAALVREAMPQPGDLKATSRAAAPAGWLMCDGQAVSRTTYAALFAAVGTAYGAGDGSTTFNVPNLKAACRSAGTRPRWSSTRSVRPVAPRRTR